MERNQTHKRRDSALRRTLRRQQRGGAVRTPSQGAAGQGAGQGAVINLQATVNKLRDNTKLTLPGTDFAFLTNPGWLTDPSSSAINYATLIARQDEFMELALRQVQTSLDISDGSTDAHIMAQLNRITDISAQEHLISLQSAAALVTLWDLQNNICSSGIQPKINYNIPIFPSKDYYAREPADLFMKKSDVSIQQSSGQFITAHKVVENKNKFYLGNILIRPMIVRNITVLSIATILKALRYDDSYSYGIVLADIADNNRLEKTFLVDKYASYLQSVSYHVTNDEPRDFLYMWGCGRGGFSKWYKFFESFMNTVSKMQMDATGNNSTITYIDINQDATSNKFEMVRYGELTGVFFNNADSSGEEILRHFMGATSITQSSGTAGGAASAGAAASVGAVATAPVIPSIIGMLEDTEWNDPIIAGTDITFGKLLKKLSVEEIHYILHLLHVYKGLTKGLVPPPRPVKVPTGGGGGGPTGGGGGGPTGGGGGGPTGGGGGAAAGAATGASEKNPSNTFGIF